MNAPQGTSEWLIERAGHATASEFASVLARVKTGEAAVRRNYRMRLVTERLTKAPVETYTNAAMQWGNATEPLARVAYEALTGKIVEEVGFMKHPKIKWVGASPDGLIDDDGGLEIKCPHVSTIHVEALESGMPAEHMAQIQGNLWVNDRKWFDFVSFDPRMPEGLQLYTQRIFRDEAYIANLMAEVGQFLVEVDAMYKRLMKRATP